MEETVILLYAILGLQITILLLILLISGVIWFRYHRRVSRIIEAGEKLLGWAADTFFPDEPEMETGNGKRNPLTVYDQADLADANLKDFSRLVIKGQFANELYEALQLCSASNLARIHLAVKQGPDELKKTVNEIDPGRDEINVMRTRIGPSILASLAYNYRVENYSKFRQELTLERKSKVSADNGIIQNGR